MKSKYLLLFVSILSFATFSSCKKDYSEVKAKTIDMQLFFPTTIGDTLNINDTIDFSVLCYANLAYYRDLERFTVNVASTNGGQNGDILGVTIKNKFAKKFKIDSMVPVGNIRCNQTYTFVIRDAGGEEARRSYQVVIK